MRGCQHCGLPTRSEYCCLGCQIAHHIIREGAQSEHKTAARLTLAFLLMMSVMMLSLFLYAEDVYGAASEPGMRWLQSAYRFASGVFASAIVALLAPDVLVRLRLQLRERTLSMDTLVVGGAAAAYGVSVVALVRGGRLYFDSAAAALTLVTAGRYLEATARANASRLLGPLVDTGPRPVFAGMPGEPLRSLAPSDLRPGMVLEVAAEHTLPVDGVALGDGEISLGVATGEPDAVTVRSGQPVPAGGVVLGTALRFRVERSPEASTLGRLSELSTQLRSTRGSIRRGADIFAVAITPLILALAVGSFLYWARADGIARGIDVALAVVLVACPCTYAVMTPLIFWLTLKKSNRRGVCIRNAEVIERLAGVRVVAFDKTGTLTTPMKVVLSDGEEDIWPIVAALESDSRHPVGRALYARAQGHRPSPVTERRNVVGGVEALDEAGNRLLLGSGALLGRYGLNPPSRARAHLLRLVKGKPELLASFRLHERPHDDAMPCIAGLRRLGIDSVVLSGDRSDRVATLVTRFGIQGEGSLSAEQKVERIDSLGQHVAAVGDGFNDTPALAAASVSFSVFGATQLARSTADVVLVNDSLQLIPETINLAKRTVRLALQSLVLVTLYNALFVGLAACGLLRPVWAGLSMLGASLAALASATRVIRAPERSQDSLVAEVAA